MRGRPSAGPVVLLLLVLVAGCGQADPAPRLEPYAVDEPLAQVDTRGMQLPTTLADLAVLDPAWDAPPQESEGVFLEARQEGQVTEFTAVDSHGEVLWGVERPAGAESVVTSGDGGDPLAVPTDPGEGSDGPSVTAYDLSSGDFAWGPVTLPGPLRGPGLTFAADPDDPASEVTVLDPASGEAVEHGGDAEVVGEYDGTVLLVEDGHLVARGTADGQMRWTLALAEQGWDADAVAPAEAAAPPGLALIGTGDSAGAVLDLAEGTVLSEDAQEAVVDAATGTLLVRGEVGIQAFDERGQDLWAQGVAPQTGIAGVGGIFLYLRDGDTLRVLNVVNGTVASAYAPDGSGSIVVPGQVLPNGAAYVRDGARILLVVAPGEGEDGATTTG